MESSPFLAPEQQLVLLKQWNQTIFPRFGFEFSERELTKVLSPPELLDQLGLSAVILVPYLGKKGNTFNALLAAIGNYSVNQLAFPFDLYSRGVKTQGLRLYTGKQCDEERRLTWEIIDFGTMIGAAPFSLRELEKEKGAGILPSAGVLAMYAYSATSLLTAVQVRGFPSLIFMPGYEVVSMGSIGIPYLDLAPPPPSWGPPELGAFFSECSEPRSTVPVFCDEQ